MAKERTLRVIVAGDADKLDRELKKANSSLDKLGKQTRLTSSITSKGFAGMRVAAVGATAGFAGLALAGKKVIEANIEAQKSQARLEAQLKASNISYQAHRKEIEAVIQKHSQLAGLDDEDLQDAFTAIVRATGDVDKSLRLVGLASDIARAKQMDVAKAGDLVAKVAGGNVGILKRYGVVVKEGATAQEALAAAQAKFSGQAEAYGKTTAGSVDRANVAFENLQETIGAALAPTVADVSDKVADFVNEMSTGTGQGGRFVDTLKDIWSEAKPIVTWIGRAAKNVASFTAEHPGLAKLAAGIVGVGVAIKGLRFVSAVTGFSHLVKAGTVAGRSLKRVLARSGAEAGEAAAANAASGITSTGRFNRAGRSAGKAIGKGMVVGLVASIPLLVDSVYNAMSPLWERISNKIGSLLSNVPVVGGVLGDLFGTGKKTPRAVSPTHKKAAGGIIPGSGRGDTVPAMLEPGEFVMQRKVVERFGPTYFAKLNDGIIPQRFMSGGQVASLARGAGFSGDALITALAVAKGESGWRESASNRNTNGSIDRGLWQINSIHGGLSTFDPAANARAAFKISGGGRNWSPWVVYQRGLHRQYMDDARAAIGASGGSSSGGSSGGSSTPDRSAQQERLGSRIVNAIARPFFADSRTTTMGFGGRKTTSVSPGISNLLNFASGRERVIGEKDTQYSQAERRFGQSEEDLGTAEGRAKRISELKELRTLKAAQLKRQMARKKALESAVKKYDGLIRALRAKLKGKKRVRGVAAARIHKRLLDYDDRRVELAAEARSLGSAIEDTKLDLGDIEGEITEVAATPDTVPEAGPEAIDRLSSDLELIDLYEAAGDMTPEAAAAERQRLRRAAVAGEYDTGEFGSALTDRQKLAIRGDIVAADKAALEAQKEATDAVNELAQAVREAKASIDAQLAFADRVSSITSMQAVRAMGDVISGQMGRQVTARSYLPGSGERSRL